VQGLLMPGQRKSIEPIAARLGVNSQRLQQFMADSPWEETQLWRVIRQEIFPHFEPIEAWIVDETGWLKQGKHSVGVARQYCEAVGKQANCQVSVELVVSGGTGRRTTVLTAELGLKTPNAVLRLRCHPMWALRPKVRSP